MNRTKTKTWSYLDIGLLLLANAYAVLLFVYGGASILQVLWIYWLQNMIIGFVNVLRIIKLPTDFPEKPKKRIVTKGIVATRDVSLRLAITFAFHFSFVHLFYAIVLLSFGTQNWLSAARVDPFGLGSVYWASVAIAGLLFALHHLASFAQEAHRYRQSRAIKSSHGSVMMRPFIRIVPLHLIVVMALPLSAFTGQTGVFVVFMILKTVVDVALHVRSVSHTAA